MSKELGQSNPQYVQGTRQSNSYNDQGTRAIKSTICPRDQGSQIHNMSKELGQSNPQYVQGTMQSNP